MHLLLLGGSGGCGRWVARLAAQRGHQVTVIVRASSAVESSAAQTTIVGDVRDPAVLRRAIDTGADAIVSCLGIRRRDPRNPWSPIDGVHTLGGPVAEALVDVVPGTNVRRVVAISSAGVAESAAQTTPVLRWVFAYSSIRIAFDDLATMERVLAASTLDWLAVRPTRLTDGPHTGRARSCTAFQLGSSISRADVAQWLLDAVEADAPIGARTPMITTT
jgi:putative NADH-flavin reductase